MRAGTILGLVLACAAALPAPGAVPAQLFYSTSTTTIPPGQSFLLGGDQRRPLRVIGTNTGRVEVAVAAVAPGGMTLIARAAPGEGFNATFDPGTTARITNASTSQAAEVRVRFNADTSAVGMRYVGPEAGSAD
jgi:hypothetical protein